MNISREELIQVARKSLEEFLLLAQDMNDPPLHMVRMIGELSYIVERTKDE